MNRQLLISGILIMGVTTLLLRLLPFWLLGHLRHHPLLTWVAKSLPQIAMPILVLFCLQAVPFKVAPYGIPELVAMVLIILVQLRRRSMILSLALGMGSYFLVTYLL